MILSNQLTFIETLHITSRQLPESNRGGVRRAGFRRGGGGGGGKGASGSLQCCKPYAMIA